MRTNTRKERKKLTIELGVFDRNRSSSRRVLDGMLSLSSLSLHEHTSSSDDALSMRMQTRKTKDGPVESACPDRPASSS
jgi:hypothetical protein